MSSPRSRRFRWPPRTEERTKSDISGADRRKNCRNRGAYCIFADTREGAAMRSLQFPVRLRRLPCSTSPEILAKSLCGTPKLDESRRGGRKFPARREVLGISHRFGQTCPAVTRVTVAISRRLLTGFC